MDPIPSWPYALKPQQTTALLSSRAQFWLFPVARATAVRPEPTNLSATRRQPNSKFELKRKQTVEKARYLYIGAFVLLLIDDNLKEPDYIHVAYLSITRICPYISCMTFKYQGEELLTAGCFPSVQTQTRRSQCFRCQVRHGCCLPSTRPGRYCRRSRTCCIHQQRWHTPSQQCLKTAVRGNHKCP